MFPVRAADCKTVRSNNSAIAGRGCRKERGLDRCQALSSSGCGDRFGQNHRLPRALV